MQILKTKGLLAGFWAVGLERILSEVIDSGEHWEAANYRIGPHVHRHWEVGYVVEGTTRVGAMGGREIFLQPGSLWCIPPNLNHWVEHGPEPKHHQIWVGVDLAAVENRHPDWSALQSLTRTSSLDDSPHLERHFRQVIREGTTASAHQPAGLRLAIDTLVLEIVRAITNSKAAPSQAALHPAISRTLTIIEGRFRENWTLSKLAEEVGLSRGRLAELFSREAGCSIHKFLTKVRVRYAEELLAHSDLPIGEIASECGFATIQHFSRVFKEVHGQPPIEFRRQVSITPGTPTTP
jgi:AraC-like DNA-binding protein